MFKSITQVCVAGMLCAGICNAGKDEELVKAFGEAVNSQSQKKVDAFLAKNRRVVKLRDSNGQTPLHIAAGNGTSAMVKAVLAKGAEVNARGRNKSTPLHQAFSGINSRKTTIAILIKAGADLKATDYRSRTPLFNCSNAIDADYMISKGAAMDVVDAQENSLLLAACWPPRPKMITYYLDNGLDPKLQNTRGETALHMLCTSGNTDPGVVKKFIDLGVGVNVPTKTGQTALHRACGSLRKGSEDVVAVLLGAGAKVDLKDNSGLQPLHSLCERRKAGRYEDTAVAIAELLLAKGAEVNAKQSGDLTPLDLLLSSRRKPEKLIEFMESKGAKTGK